MAAADDAGQIRLTMDWQRQLSQVEATLSTTNIPPSTMILEHEPVASATAASMITSAVFQPQNRGSNNSSNNNNNNNKHRKKAQQLLLYQRQPLSVKSRIHCRSKTTLTSRTGCSWILRITFNCRNSWERRTLRKMTDSREVEMMPILEFSKMPWRNNQVNPKLTTTIWIHNDTSRFCKVWHNLHRPVPTQDHLHNQNHEWETLHNHHHPKPRSTI